MKLQKIVPNLWFVNQAEEAARFYTSVFNEEKSQKVMAAILKMKKIEINGLREVFDQ